MSSASAAESSLRKTLKALEGASPTAAATTQLLQDAKKQLMRARALIPSDATPPALLPLARSILEAGALLSIRAQDPDAFTRYFQQLQPFYALPPAALPRQQGAGSGEGRSKVTGLYLLLLLTKGDYAGFHTVLEGLEADEGQSGGGLDDDKFIRYPVMLEQWLMEGAYDRVWTATKGEGVPSEEFGMFSEILVHTIRSEIASCSEKSYPSIPVASAKNLLFLDSEGAVVEFARQRGWEVRADDRIYFPAAASAAGEEGAGAADKDGGNASGTIIENTIGYARELETIV